MLHRPPEHRVACSYNFIRGILFRGSALQLMSPSCARELFAISFCQEFALLNIRFGSKADICSAKRHVRFTPESDIPQCSVSQITLV